MEILYLFGLMFLLSFVSELAPLLLLTAVVAFLFAGPFAVVAVIFLGLIFHSQKKHRKQKRGKRRTNSGWETLNTIKPPFKKLIDLRSDSNEL